LPPSLDNVPFLHSLKDTIVDKVLAEAVLLECEAGEKIIKEGDSSKFFCILLKGAVDIVKGGKKLSSISHSGEMLGELALVNDHHRMASVVASTHSFFLKIEPEFLDTMDDAERNGFYAKLYQFVSRILGERLEEASEKILKLENKILKLSGISEDGDSGAPAVYRL
jgi:CRP-like cAMP-binding protein